MEFFPPEELAVPFAVTTGSDVGVGSTAEVEGHLTSVSHVSAVPVSRIRARTRRAGLIAQREVRQLRLVLSPFTWMNGRRFDTSYCCRTVVLRTAKTRHRN